MPKRTQLSEAEREQRRAADRAFVQQALEQLRSSEGWQRWLATRRHFHTYSLRNQLLLAMQKRAAHCLLTRDDCTSGPADRVNSRQSATSRRMTTSASSGPNALD
jgi:hypothetical protein